MKKVFTLGLALLVVLAITGCYGPNKISRMFDDWGNQMYVDSPWLAQLLLYVGVFGIGMWVCQFIDMIVLNVIDFWGESAFRGYGTPFNHQAPTVPTHK